MRLLIGGDPELPYKLHGVSLHEEIRSFREAGFTPAEIVALATRHAAEFLDVLDEQGTIRVGKAPDFILVRGNPLRRSENLLRVEGMMLRGRWLSREDLEARRQRLEAKFAGTP